MLLRHALFVVPSVVLGLLLGLAFTGRGERSPESKTSATSATAPALRSSPSTERIQRRAPLALTPPVFDVDVDVDDDSCRVETLPTTPEEQAARDDREKKIEAHSDAIERWLSPHRARIKTCIGEKLGGAAGLLHVVLVFEAKQGVPILTAVNSHQGMFPEARAKTALECFADIIGEGYPLPPNTPAVGFHQHLALRTPGTPEDLQWDAKGWDVEDYADPAVTGREAAEFLTATPAAPAAPQE